MKQKNPKLAGRHEALDSCKDAFRYKLVGEDGRYRFEVFRFIGKGGCDDPQLSRLASLIEGKWLDEIDLDEICRCECRQGRSVGCPREVVRMVGEIRGFLAEDAAE